MTEKPPEFVAVLLARWSEFRERVCHRGLHWVRFIGVRRMVTGAACAVTAAVAGWWLVRPAAAPVEVAIPVASTVVVSGAPTSTEATVVRVHVAGAVRRPGVYALASGARVVDAVRAAGGATESADLERINLAQTILDTEQVMVPRRGSTRVTVAPRHVPRRRVPATTSSIATEGGAASQTPPSSTGSGAVVNLNSAGVDQLDTLPGIGPATAKAIVAHRTRKGPFSRVEDLLSIDGIGPKKLEAIRDLVSL